ncbi:MAG: DUF308 domain-containing protein [Lachnospiraceae bacterium]|nr:DUF308 domain-containing protein [Lachnospiraceae bacterium]
MDIVMIILGVIMVICGGTCMFTPVVTFMEMGYFLMILLLVYGIAGIVKAIVTKEYSLAFGFSIVSVIVGIIMAVTPTLRLATDEFLIYIMACWFILKGVLSIWTSVKAKGTPEGKNWIWGIVIGAIGILLGIYSIFHPMVLAFAMGVLIGAYFVVGGIDMIVVATQLNKGESA